MNSFISRSGVSLKAGSAGTKSPLAYAAYSGDLQIFEMLVNQGANGKLQLMQIRPTHDWFVSMRVKSLSRTSTDGTFCTTPYSEVTRIWCSTLSSYSQASYFMHL